MWTGVVFVLGFALLALCKPAQAAQPPNFVLIVADDLGYGDLHTYGHPRFETPHLDRMASEGVRFTDFYMPMPYCAPSRSSILTGRYPFRTTVVRNPAPDNGVNDIGLPASEITIAAALKKAGYATCAIGKWHLGHVPGFLPRERGFDEYYGILYSNDMRPVQLVENERVVEYPVVQALLTRRYTERALAFMEKNRQRPFFLYLAHAMPHKPLAVSEDFYRPKGGPQELYAAVIRELDWSVGEVLRKLDELGLTERTLVIFTSDNGPWYGGSTGGLRGMKGDTFDGGVRVPFIARWPGRIPKGLVVREVAGAIDIFPTLVRLAGLKLPEDRIIDGKDIFPLMTTPGTKSPHEAVFIMSGPQLYAVRSGKWKLHVRAPELRRLPDPKTWVDPRGPDGVTILAPYEQARPDLYPGVQTGDPPKPMMLFDMEADPAEQRDVSNQYPDVVKRLRQLFDRVEAEAKQAKLQEARGWQGVRRIKGGELRYDRILP